MLFNSYIFLLVFLPLALCFYFTLNRMGHERMALGSLAVMSLWFYGYFNYSYLLIIIASILVNFWFSKKMIGLIGGRKKKIILGLALLFNIGLLFYYKYYDFFISNINQVFSLSFHMKHIVLPLGISFFTFQQISYAIDCYRNEVPGGGIISWIIPPM